MLCVHNNNYFFTIDSARLFIMFLLVCVLAADFYEMFATYTFDVNFIMALYIHRKSTMASPSNNKFSHLCTHTDFLVIF